MVRVVRERISLVLFHSQLHPGMNVHQKSLTTSYEDPEGKPLSRGGIQLR